MICAIGLRSLHVGCFVENLQSCCNAKLSFSWWPLWRKYDHKSHL